MFLWLNKIWCYSRSGSGVLELHLFQNNPSSIFFSFITEDSKRISELDYFYFGVLKPKYHETCHCDFRIFVTIFCFQIPMERTAWTATAVAETLMLQFLFPHSQPRLKRSLDLLIYDHFSLLQVQLIFA